MVLSVFNELQSFIGVASSFIKFQSARIDSLITARSALLWSTITNSNISCINTTVFEPIGLRAPVLDRSESRLYVIPQTSNCGTWRFAPELD